MGIAHAAAPGLWAGVDVGTQSLRVLLVDEHGTVIGRGSGRLDSRRAGPSHEQDPAQWWRVFGDATRQALRAAEAAYPKPGRHVRGLAMCGTSGTFLLAGADGAAQTPALMYDDARAERDGFDPVQWAGFAHRIQPTWAIAKLVWLLRFGPAPIREGITAGRLGLRHCTDHLAERLAGHPVATDWSHALKTGYDAQRDAFPTAALNHLGIPDKVLPEVVRPGTLLARVGAAGAEHTGLAEGTPIRAGMSDGCAAQIAAGALDAGSWNAVLGTTLVLKGVTDDPPVDPTGAVYSHRHPDRGWLPGGASSVGARVLTQRFPHADHDRYDDAAKHYEPAGGLVYPLAGRGERFPFVRPDAEAFTIGRFANEYDQYAAILQAVAYVEKLAYAHLRRLGARVDGPLYITGGGTRSAYWRQLRADILGRELNVPSIMEPAFGMAVVAAAGDGPLAGPAARMIRVGETVTPRPGATQRFSDPYARFLDALTDRGWIDADLSRFAKEVA